MQIIKPIGINTIMHKKYYSITHSYTNVYFSGMERLIDKKGNNHSTPSMIKPILNTRVHMMDESHKAFFKYLKVKEISHLSKLIAPRREQKRY